MSVRIVNMPGHVYHRFGEDGVVVADSPVVRPAARWEFEIVGTYGDRSNAGGRQISMRWYIEGLTYEKKRVREKLIERARQEGFERVEIYKVIACGHKAEIYLPRRAQRTRRKKIERKTT